MESTRLARHQTVAVAVQAISLKMNPLNFLIGSTEEEKETSYVRFHSLQRSDPNIALILLPEYVSTAQ